MRCRSRCSRAPVIGCWVRSTGRCWSRCWWARCRALRSAAICRRALRMRCCAICSPPRSRWSACVSCCPEARRRRLGSRHYGAPPKPRLLEEPTGQIGLELSDPLTMTVVIGLRPAAASHGNEALVLRLARLRTGTDLEVRRRKTVPRAHQFESRPIADWQIGIAQLCDSHGIDSSSHASQYAWLHGNYVSQRTENESWRGWHASHQRRFKQATRR
ncbi:hypothetical protein BN2475_380114 [Paraburkholderia ribeironis]|uniref:Uncharacterized protein n=1 Tax=Paraburkholderia ribeironis TaxID=1247936 RepID=A0A1N7S607_9BURK|nr:hypothetical protein BN2475_380114 [Paraburkholderia ribeironis]